MKNPIIEAIERKHKEESKIFTRHFVAEAIGLSKGYLTAVEKGTIKNVSKRIIVHISAALLLDIQEMDKILAYYGQTIFLPHSRIDEELREESLKISSAVRKFIDISEERDNQKEKIKKMGERLSKPRRKVSGDKKTPKQKQQEIRRLKAKIKLLEQELRDSK